MSNVMVRLFCILGLLLLSSAGAAGAGQFFVDAAIGSDSNSCGPTDPCKTISHAIGLISPTGDRAGIQVACGIYPEAIDIFYYRLVVIDGAGPCTELQARADDKGNAPFVIWAQDHAIVIVSNLAITSHRAEGTCVGARQFAIVDLANITFAGCRVHITAREQSRISEVRQITINGNAVAHAEANDGSTINLSATYVFNESPHIDYFIVASDYSRVYARSMTIRDGNTVGMKYHLNSAKLDTEATLPGSGHECFGGSIADGAAC
jgi:hypothetical protein